MEIARSGGVTKAAQKLNLTPSAVSQSLRSLETSLDVLLFDRVGKQLLLTRDGRTLLTHLTRYQEGLRDALNLLQGGEKRVRGRIRLGIFYGFSNRLAAQFLSTVRENHPDIEVDVIFAAPSELDRLLKAKRLDFVINLFFSRKDPALLQKKLGVEELWLVSSQPPPRRALSLPELKKAPFIDYYRKSRLVGEWITHHFGQTVRDLPTVMHASHSELIVQLILEGVGIGIVASSIARSYVEDGRLFVIRGKKRQMESTIWFKELADEQDSPAANLFRQELLAHFQAAIF